MSDAVLGAVVTAASGVLLATLSLMGSRRLTRADVAKDTSEALVHEATAEQVRVDTAIKAADYIARLAAQNQRQQSAIDRLCWAAERHSEWDELVTGILQQLRDALTAAGIAHGIPDVPPPPPIKVDIPST